MSLKINSPQGEITNMKYRKEGNGEDGAVPLDITVSCLTSGSILKALIGSDNTGGFWRADEDKSLMYPYLDKCSVATGRKVEHCQLSIGGVELKNCTLSKFSFVVQAGNQVELHFNCAAKEVTGAQVDRLRPLLKSASVIKATGGDLVDIAEDEPEEDDSQKDIDDIE